MDRRRRRPQGGRPPRAGHTSVSFTLDRYGHLYSEADTGLRDRLDALYAAGAQAEPGEVNELRRDASRAPARPRNDESAVDDAPTTL